MSPWLFFCRQEKLPCVSKVLMSQSADLQLRDEGLSVEDVELQ